MQDINYCLKTRTELSLIELIGLSSKNFKNYFFILDVFLLFIKRLGSK